MRGDKTSHDFIGFSVERPNTSVPCTAIVERARNQFPDASVRDCGDVLNVLIPSDDSLRERVESFITSESSKDTRLSFRLIGAKGGMLATYPLNQIKLREEGSAGLVPFGRVKES